MAWKLCKECGQPMLPRGRKKRHNEFDHASGCPKDSDYKKYIKEIRRTVESRPEWKRGGTKLVAPEEPTNE